MKYITGIGSRDVSPEIGQLLTARCYELCLEGYILRSGGAEGSDTYCEYGCDLAKGKKEIFLPWRNFNNNKSSLFEPSPEAFEIASTIHPVWDSLKDSVKRLHARNVHQILGTDLKTPSEMVICFTEGGKIVGGTATALKLALRYNIPIQNFGEIQ